MHHFPDNLGLSTDLLLHAETGIVEQRNDYIVVRTPDAPDYFFGNMLVLQQRPSEIDLEHLEQDFALLIGTPPLIAHRAFTWPESASGVVNAEAFSQNGYSTTICRVLVAHPQEIRPVATNRFVEVRKFGVQQDWDDWSRMQLADMPNPTDIASQHFIADQQTAHKRLIDRGLGNWWGAFIDGEQVGSLGLFFLDGIGRFRSVITSEHHRNRNICKTLMSEVAKLNSGRSDRLVIVADETYHAAGLYEAMGFRQQGRVASSYQAPRDTAAC
jgi:ribosomal protein S18 acetylase RimI-like enzyme